MTTPLFRYNETERLKALLSYHQLDTSPEEDFDNITYLASFICQTPISLISLVGKERQFFKSHLGLSASEASGALSFTAHTIDQSQRIFEVEDARLDERFQDNDLVISNQSIVFYAGIPLLTIDGFTIGTLCVIDKKPRILTPEQKEALIKLSKQVIFIIEARQKKAIIEELKLFDFTFLNSTMPIFLVKEDSSIYNINEAAAKNLGYSIEELKGKKIIELDDSFDKEKWGLHWAEIKAKGSITIETTPKKKDGTIAYFIIHINYLKHGDLELICSYLTNVTEQKNQEKQMKLIDFSFRNSKTPVHIINKDSSLFDYNEAAYQLLGYTKDEYKALSIPDLEPDNQNNNWPIHWEELKKAGSLSFETKLKKKNGEIIIANVEANFIQYGDQELNCNFFTDITEKKKLEVRLAFAEYAFKSSMTPTVFLRKDASFFDFNEAYLKEYGYTREEVYNGKMYDLHGGFDAESWSEYWQVLKERGGMNFETTRRMKNGETKDVEIKAQIVQFGELEIDCVYITDLTEKKKIEASIKLAAFTIENAVWGIVYFKQDGTIYSCNLAFAKMYGFDSLEEVMLKTIYDFGTGFTPETWKQYWDDLKAKKISNYNSKRTKKDGTIIDVEINPNYVEYGDLELNCVYVYDATEKIILHHKIDKQRVFYEDVLNNIPSEIAVFDADYRYRFINPAALSNPEIREWIIGKNDEEYVALKKGSIGRVRENRMNAYMEAVEKKKIISWEEKLKNKMNENVYMARNIYPVLGDDGQVKMIIGYAYNTTNIHKANEKARLFELGFRNIQTPSIIIDIIDGTLYDYNEAALNLLGYSNDEFKEINISEIDILVDNEEQIQFNYKISELKAITRYTSFKKRDNTLIKVECKFQYLLFDGKELNYVFFTDITQKLREAQELEQSNQRYEYATLATSDVIWEADLVKKKIFISKNFTTFFGHSVADGWMPIENNIWRQNIHPDEVDFIMEDQYAVLSSDASNNKWIGEYRLKNADGIYATVKDKTFAIKDEKGNIVRMVGAMQDISKQRMEEERLRLMESVILNTNDAVLITEAEPISVPGPKILFVNKAFTKMTGYSQEELFGKTPRIFQNEETDRKELDKFRDALEKWEPSDVTLLNSKKNGEKYWVNIRTTPIADEKGWFTHWISIEKDVTKEKEAEKEKEKLLKELVENNLELKQFSYITSHNLRAPLTNLVSICNMIKPGIGTDALTLQLIDIFKVSTYHLNETLNDLIEVLIIKEKKNIKKEQLTFEEILEKITQSLSLSLLEKRVIINADFSAAPVIIFANEYLESIFLNLITNAVKYRHPDRDPIITIKTWKELNGDTKLTFSDNGIGINMAYAKDQIFGLYKRFHDNADSKGIGLYLIHSQITTLGGKIEVESEVNIGTTFTITFK